VKNKVFNKTAFIYFAVTVLFCYCKNSHSTNKEKNIECSINDIDDFNKYKKDFGITEIKRWIQLK